MNKNYFIVPIILTIAGTLFISSTNGPQDDYTGAPSSNGNCKNCHTGSANLGASLNIVATLKGTATPVSTFEAGKTYNIAVAVTGGTSTKRGYQATVLNPSNATVGTFANPSTGARIGNYNGRSILEHTATNLLGAGTMEWTAPSSSVPDSVIIYAAGNASNSGNGTDGDQGLVNKMTLYLNKAASTQKHHLAALKSYPNPCSNSLNFPGICSEIQLYSINGKLLASAQNTNTMQIAGFENGIYIVKWKISGIEITEKIIKN